jgi:hypothetical protein
MRYSMVVAAWRTRNAGFTLKEFWEMTYPGGIIFGTYRTVPLKRRTKTQ